MRIKLISAGLLAGAAVLASPAAAAAAPSGAPLPDAHLYCGSALADVPTFAFSTPMSDAFWITSGPYAGKWNITYEAHYVTPGLVDEPAPLADLTPSGPYEFAGDKYFGEKTGQTDTVTCEIVSKWDLGADSFTVFAPLSLARTS